MKKFFLTNSVMVLSCLFLLTSSLQAQNFTTSAQYGSWSVNGYTIYNDVWGSGAGAQSLWAYDQGNWGVWSDQPNTGGIKSYPNVSYPVNYTVSSMPTITSSFNVTTPGWGSYESTYDIWYSNNSYEIMLWMNYYGSVGPISYNYGCSGYPSTACPVATNISVGGQTWNLYSGSNGSNTVYSFIRTSNTSSGTVNITQISQYLANHGYFSSSSTLQTIQFGFEITSCSGGANFQVNSYGVSVGSSGGSGGGSGTSYYQIQNRATGLYTDGMGRSSNGSNCGQWSNSSSYNQQWSIVSSGSYVKLQNRATGLYLDGMGRTSNGSAAGQWSSSGSYNQQWQEVSAGSYIKFKNRATGLYLDGMGRTSNGSDMGQWSSSSSYNQQWSIIGPKAAESVIHPVENANVTVYPNPTNGSIDISLAGITGKSEIRLLDLNGKTVNEWQTVDKKQIQLDLNVSPGVYIIQVINGENNIMKKIIVK